MLPRKLQTAIGTCAFKAFVKKASSRKQLRALLIKRAVDRLSEAYKLAPSQTKLQKVTRTAPVPGSPGRESALRPSMAKAALNSTPSTGNTAPKLNSAPKLAPPSKLSAGTQFFNPSSPVNMAMRAPAPKPIAPRPKPGQSNTINYGVGPSGRPVSASIVNQGVMPVPNAPAPTAAERASDIVAADKQRAFNDRMRRAGNTSMIAGPSNYRSKAQRMAERAQPQSIPLSAPAEPAAAPELTSTPIAAAPEIPDVQTDSQLPIPSGSELQSKAREIAFPTPASTPNYAAMSPSQQLNAADASSPQVSPQRPTPADLELHRKAQEIAFPTPAPTPNYAVMSPSQQLDAAQSSAPTKSLAQADQPANMSPDAVIANLLTQLGQGAGRGLSSLQSLPGYLTRQMQGVFNNPLNYAPYRQSESPDYSHEKNLNDYYKALQDYSSGQEQASQRRQLAAGHSRRLPQLTRDLNDYPPMAGALDFILNEKDRPTSPALPQAPSPYNQPVR